MVGWMIKTLNLIDVVYIDSSTNDFMPLFIFAKSSITDVWQGLKYAFA